MIKRLTPLLLVLGFNWLAATNVPATPVGTAINYQGYVMDKNKPATGLYDFVFKLYDASSGGSLVGSPNTINLSAVPVTNGLFSVALDFGATAFQGDARWLDTAIAPNGSVTYTSLGRIELRPTPNSVFSSTANTATTANGVTANSLTTAAFQNNSITAAKIAPGEVVKSLNGLSDAVTLAAGSGLTLTPSGNTLTLASSSGAGWLLNGNNGTTAGTDFLGTRDNQPFELKVNNSRALRLELVGSALTFVSVNSIGGYKANRVSNGARGATIAGGGYTVPIIFNGDVVNEIKADFGTIGGGSANTVRWGQHATIAGGFNNLAGYDVPQTGDYSAVGGGNGNNAEGDYATVPGGHLNWARGANSFAAGNQAKATQDGAFVWSSYSQPASSFSANRFHVFAQNGFSVDYDAQRVDGGGAHWAGFGVISGQTLSSWTGAFLEDNGDWHCRYAVCYGEGNELAYLGGDGVGNDVQIGSLNPGVMNLAAYNPATGHYMNMYVGTLTITGGSDLSEPFEVSEPDLPKGSVVIIDEENPGHLKLSDHDYDTRVAGVVSGAGGVEPGIRMSQRGVLDGGQNIALTGRVYVQADASFGAIKPGDLLTTSMTPGHAMRVTDHARAQGAVLGKAMSSLSEGKGTVLILVSLQ
jgi:hypothetical protein